MTDKTDVMRGEFEAWFCGPDCSVPDIYRSEALESYQAALQSPAVRELVDALKLARKELDGLPHSLGYDFTHTPKIDKALANFASIQGDKA